MPLASRAPATPPEARASVLKGGERADQSGVDFAAEAAAAQAVAVAFASSAAVVIQPVTLPPVVESYGFAEGDPNVSDG